ncbi:MAG: hypothetical protein ACO39W_06935, partial [Schleiferiaceae bacterium]
EQLKELKRGCVDLLPEEDFKKKLEESYEKDIPLKIKFGADPSRPDIRIWIRQLETRFGEGVKLEADKDVSRG